MSGCGRFTEAELKLYHSGKAGGMTIEMSCHIKLLRCADCRAVLEDFSRQRRGPTLDIQPVDIRPHYGRRRPSKISRDYRKRLATEYRKVKYA